MSIGAADEVLLRFHVAMSRAMSPPEANAPTTRTRLPEKGTGEL